jgi:hypothetical protein
MRTSQPFLTEEERKREVTQHVEGFQFKHKVDLSDGVEITPVFDYNHATLSRAIAVFTAGFMLWTHPRLNGFSGVDTIEWKIVDNGKFKG